MASRTPEGKHVTRFIILVAGEDKQFVRAGNDGLAGFFLTKEAAQAALDTPGNKSEWLTYRIRQK
jgi:hypothetical protein